MSEEQESRPEGRLRRWSRRKSGGGEAAPEPEAPEKTKKRGSAAPVAGRRLAPLMPPLAEPEEGEIEMEAAPPGALALKAQLEAEKAAREEEDEAEEERELTPEEEEAVKDLPPIKSLNKDSDFTPFFAQNVPDFLKRQAYKVLWRSNPIFNIRDGLDDYDEDFSLAKLVGNVLSETKGASKSAKAKSAKDKEADEAKAPAPEKGDEAAETAAVEDEDDFGDVDGEDDDLGDAEDENGGEDGREIAAEDADSGENPSKSS